MKPQVGYFNNMNYQAISMTSNDKVAGPIPVGGTAWFDGQSI
jgi:hypothetical protein